MKTDPQISRSGRLWSPDFPHAPRRWPLFYGWILVILSSAGLLASMPGQTMGFTVFIEILMRELNLTRDQISLAYLAGTLLSGFLLPYGGTYFDRKGARKTMVYASIGMGGVCLLFSFIDRTSGVVASLLPWIPPMIIACLVTGTGFFMIRFVGQGMMQMSANAMLGKWFYHRRGIVQSMRGLITAIGISMTPLALNALLQQFGWRASYWILALTCGLIMALAAWWFFRDNPEECGLTMDGNYQPPGGKPRTDDLIIVRDLTRAEALRSYSFWIFTLIFCTNSFFVTGFAFHMISVGNSLQMREVEILAIFIPVTLVSIPANFLTGWVSDRTRLKYLFACMALAQVLAGLSIFGLPGWGGKLFFALGIGVAGGAFSALSGIVWPRYYGRRHLGAISGFFMSLTVISSALGPFLFSRIYTTWETYLPAFMIPVFFGILLFFGCFFAENPQRRLRAVSTSSGE